MKILITGGAGFIGTHLSRFLLKEGHEISILDNFLPQVHGCSTSLAADIARHVRLIHGDVAEETALRNALDGAEWVIHLAAETGTGQSMYEVARYESANVRGTALLYDLLSKQPGRHVERILVASSRAIYGEGAYQCATHGIVYPCSRTVEDKLSGQFDPLCPNCDGACESMPTPESAPFQPSSFYGLTKQIQEQMVVMFGKALRIPSLALRYQNVYGPGQSLKNPYTGILAIFSNLARAARPIRVFEDGLESRDFVYVDDVVRGTVQGLNSSLQDSRSINIGSGVRTRVLDVANGISGFFGSPSETQISGEFRDGDVRHCTADITLARTLLQYEPKWSFADGLRKFLAWASEDGPEIENYDRSMEELQERGFLHGGK